MSKNRDDRVRAATEALEDAMNNYLTVAGAATAHELVDTCLLSLKLSSLDDTGTVRTRYQCYAAGDVDPGTAVDTLREGAHILETRFSNADDPPIQRFTWREEG